TAEGRLQNPDNAGGSRRISAGTTEHGRRRTLLPSLERPADSRGSRSILVNFVTVPERRGRALADRARRGRESAGARRRQAAAPGSLGPSARTRRNGAAGLARSGAGTSDRAARLRCGAA